MAIKLIGKQIILRRFRKIDAEDIKKNINDEAIVRYTTNIPHPYSIKDAYDFFRKLKKNREKEIAFGVVLKSTNKVVGGISLMKIDCANKNAELGYWLGKNYWGRGIATEAVGLVLDLALKKWKFHRVYANTFHKNIASQKLLKKFGFNLEGRMREKWFRENQWRDVLNFGILDREYKKYARKSKK